MFLMVRERIKVSRSTKINRKTHFRADFVYRQRTLRTSDLTPCVSSSFYYYYYYYRFPVRHVAAAPGRFFAQRNTAKAVQLLQSSRCPCPLYYRRRLSIFFPAYHYAHGAYDMYVVRITDHDGNTILKRVSGSIRIFRRSKFLRETGARKSRRSAISIENRSAGVLPVTSKGKSRVAVGQVGRIDRQ